MIRRNVTRPSWAALLAATAAMGQEPSQPEGEAANGSPRTIEVVELHYADAEEVAFVLSQVLPPTVTVVAYRPTNSLIIARVSPSGDDCRERSDRNTANC